MRRLGNVTWLLIAAFLLSGNSHALVTFPKGTCQLEGYLYQGMTEGSWLFIVNEGTDSETRFRLSETADKMADRVSGDRIRMTIEIAETTESRYAVAKLIRIDAWLNPYNEMKDYNSSSDLRDVCKNIAKLPQK